MPVCTCTSSALVDHSFHLPTVQILYLPLSFYLLSYLQRFILLPVINSDNKTQQLQTYLLLSATSSAILHNSPRYICTVELCHLTMISFTKVYSPGDGNIIESRHYFVILMISTLITKNDFPPNVYFPMYKPTSSNLKHN